MKKFPALHTISSIFKIMSWIVGIATAIMFFLTIAGLSQYSAGGGFITGLLILLAGGFYALILYAIAEGILVILAIEENTRTKEEDNGINKITVGKMLP